MLFQKITSDFKYVFLCIKCEKMFSKHGFLSLFITIVWT